MTARLRAFGAWWQRHPFFSAVVVMTAISVVGYARLSNISDHQGNDEACLRSVVRAQSERSAILSDLNTKKIEADASRTAADVDRQHWTTVQNRVFKAALAGTDPATIRHRFAYANRHYLAADRRWHRLNDRYTRISDRYDRAAQAHPVPKLECSGGNLDQPAPTVTRTATSTATRTEQRTATATATATATSTAAAAPAPTDVVTAPGSTATLTRSATARVTVTAPPRTETVTVTPSCVLAVAGRCVTLAVPTFP